MATDKNLQLKEPSSPPETAPSKNLRRQEAGINQEIRIARIETDADKKAKLMEWKQKAEKGKWDLNKMLKKWPESTLLYSLEQNAEGGFEDFLFQVVPFHVVNTSYSIVLFLTREGTQLTINDIYLKDNEGQVITDEHGTPVLSATGDIQRRNKGALIKIDPSIYNYKRNKKIDLINRDLLDPNNIDFYLQFRELLEKTKNPSAIAQMEEKNITSERDLPNKNQEKSETEKGPITIEEVNQIRHPEGLKFEVTPIDNHFFLELKIGDKYIKIAEYTFKRDGNGKIKFENSFPDIGPLKILGKEDVDLNNDLAKLIELYIGYQYANSPTDAYKINMDGFRHDFVETLAKAKMESLNKEISPRFRITTGNSNNYYIEMLKLDQIKSTQESDWMPIIGFELDMINKNGQIALAPSSHKTFLKKTLPLRGGQKPNWIKIRAEKAKFQPFADEPELLHEALKAYILQLEDITKLDPAFLFQICIENDSIIADAVKKNPQLQNTYR